MTTPFGGTYPVYDPYSQASSLLPYSTQGQIPGYAIGAWGMTVNTSQLNFASSTVGGGMFGYSGIPGQGNLYFALAAADGTDQFGNQYGAGLNVAGGTLATVSLIGAIMDTTTVIQGATYQNGNVLTPSITGGTAASLVHTMTNTGGQVLGYTQGATSVTFATNGLYLWTVPTGVFSIRAQAWGAGAGGSGGSATQGGEGGGGGEYAEEPLLGVNPGTVYVINVGQGGSGAITGQSGGNGGDTTFAPNGFAGTIVAAHGGNGGFAFTGGGGGTGSTNAIHFDGGNGANGSGQVGGNGGGASGGTTNQGNPGVQSAGPAGGSGGAAPLNGGAGGGGGASDLPGGTGGAPGGGGGGAGGAVINSHTKTYNAVNTYSYYGADSNGYPPDVLRQLGGGMWQGYSSLGPNTTLLSPGNQFSYWLLPFAKIQSDLTGVTVSSVTVSVKAVSVAAGNNLHCILSYSNVGNFSSNAPVGGSSVQVAVFSCTVGKATTVNIKLNGNIGIALQNGNAKSMLVGPVLSSLLTNAAYWGMFDSGEAGFAPRITVNYYTGTTVVKAGDGADGKVVLSFNPSVPALNLAIASVSSTDAYGYTFGPGFTGGQFNLVGSATPPAATAGSSSLAANTAGTPTVSLPSGYSGLLGSAQVDTTPFTVTQAAQTQLTKLWNIQAGDAQVNTKYRITASGYGTWGSTQQTLQSVGCIDRSNITGGGGVGRIAAAAFAASTPVCWRAEFEISVVSTGTSGTIIPTLNFWISANAAGISPGTAAVNSITVVTGPSNTLTTLNTTVSHTMDIESLWGSTTGAPTITCLTSSFERLGT